MSKTRIVIVVPSPISRSLIGRRLAALPDVALVGEAQDPAEVFALIETTRPDLAVLGPGVAASTDFRDLNNRLASAQCRWIEIAAPRSSLAGDGPHGDRPVLSHGMTPTQIGQALAEVMAAPLGRAGHAAACPVSAGDAPRPTAHPENGNRFILIGASTGGVDALLRILADFPPDCPPTAIVQHTGRGNGSSLIQLLAKSCRAEVVAPRDGMELRRGMIGVAAGGDAHLRIAAGSVLRCLLRPGLPVSGHLPSVDALFGSAVPWAANAVAVILTGMGRDGAAGLLKLRRGGAVTIGQDEASSLVYGMPKAAWELGAVGTRLPLDRIASAALHACQKGLPG